MTAAIDRHIARVLVARPAATAEEVRRIVPDARTLDDRALAAKIEHLRARARSTALGRPRK